MNKKLVLMPVLLCVVLSGCVPSATRAGSPSGSQDVYYFPYYNSAPGPVILEENFDEQTPNTTYVVLQGCSAVAKASDVRKLGLEVSRKVCIQAMQRGTDVDPIAIAIVGGLSLTGVVFYLFSEFLKNISSRIS